MRQQYVKLFSFLLGLTFILSGTVYTFVNTYKEKKENVKKEEIEIADEIGNVYKTLYDKGNDLSTFRKKFVNDLSEYVSYYQDMPDGYKKIVNGFEKYEEYLNEMEDMSSYLKSKCAKNYSVTEANEKCYFYYKLLEKTINMYVEDLKIFNNKIDEYNEWIKEENESEIKEKTYEKLSKHNSKNYTDYVDLNKDGTYLGMNSD